MEESDAETSYQLFHVLRFSPNYGMLDCCSLFLRNILLSLRNYTRWISFHKRVKELPLQHETERSHSPAGGTGIRDRML